MQGMLESKEIRWFFKENNKEILNWFSGQGINFSNIKPRTDFYLVLPEKDDLNIKLREGNIEIKQRFEKPIEHKIAENATGYLENCAKWSFDLQNCEKLSQDIIHNRNQNWIEVYKERLGVKATKDEDGNMKIVEIKERIPYGCQIEYTKIKANGEEWFTFGLEWFGDKHLEIDNTLLSEILHNVNLERQDSFGYSVFINYLINK